MVPVGEVEHQKKAMEEEVAHLIEAEAVVVEHMMTVRAVE
jgi:hypothetical protein